MVQINVTEISEIQYLFFLDTDFTMILHHQATPIFKIHKLSVLLDPPKIVFSKNVLCLSSSDSLVRAF